ncbi:sensor histidine kinase [Clostridium fungisolvens]|uniref:histidine kinase n=1 Tax=Clostridium fungisolvens TaxID=1604897 RepID=A0A6V8SEV1_9CLOT|nr:ATP-binding protein [Clostridium fungisolvens]GFP75112.1 Sensor histidine kinase RcsC [Clostridium fungisolvens]
MNDNSIIKSKNIVLKLFIPLLLIIILVYEKNRDYMFFHQFVEILCTTFGASLTMMSINRFNLRRHNLFTYIGLGFSVICIANLVHILSFNDGKKYEQVLNFTLPMWLITSWLEHLVIILSLYFNKKAIGYLKAVTIFFAGGVAIFASLLMIYYYTKSNSIAYRRFIFINLNWGIIILIFIFVFIAVLGSTSISNDSKKYILVYLSLVIIYESIAKVTFTSYDNINYNIILTVHILKYLAYYTLFEGISKFLIQGTYSEMYEELKQMEKDQKHYSSILQKRMNLEIELQKMMEMSKSKYNILINSIPDSILIFEYEKINFINSSAKKLLEFICGDYKKIEKLKLGEFIDYIGSLSSTYTALEKNSMNFSIDIDGSIRLYDISTECINNKICVVLIRDVTDIGKIKNLKSELEGYIKDDEIKRQFYTNISHELRTPINVIFSALQLNDLYLLEKNKSGLSKNGENIKRNCLRLIRTINNFIDTNKLSEGYLTPDMKIYNIVDLVEDVAQSTIGYIEKFNMKLTFDVDEEEIYVKCDKELIERVILNLLSNNVKYGKPGGFIFVSITCDSDFVDICILNDSDSISEEEQDYIFDKFSKNQYSLNSRKEGSGLGLFISKALIELQEGEIKLNSFNYGNRFDIKFKRTKDYRGDYIEYKNANINELKEKVDIEFSDIYI